MRAFCISAASVPVVALFSGLGRAPLAEGSASIEVIAGDGRSSGVIERGFTVGPTSGRRWSVNRPG